MGKKGQRARQRKRLAKLGDEQRRAALRQRQEESQQPAEQRPAEEAELIRAYHTLEKRLAAVAADPALKTEAEREARRAALRAEQAALGGLDAYQRASLGGESSEQFAQFSASEWVLEELGGKPLTATHKSAQRTEPLALPAGADSPGAPPLRLLDVGAIVNHYPCAEPAPEPEPQPALAEGALLGPALPGGRQLHVTSIDLNPREPSVIRADFFPYARQQLQRRGEGCFDIVVLSLVMNFVGEPAARGEMLRLCARLLPPSGLLFLVLPEPCIYNSRYLKFGLLDKILRSVGLPIIDGGYKRTPKLFFALCRRTESGAEPEPEPGARSFKRQLVRGGKDRNNFCIVLAHAGSEGSGGGRGSGGGQGQRRRKKKRREGGEGGGSAQRKRHRSAQ